MSAYTDATLIELWHYHELQEAVFGYSIKQPQKTLQNAAYPVATFINTNMWNGLDREDYVAVMLAVYGVAGDVREDLSVVEHNLYGSDRIGMYKHRRALISRDLEGQIGSRGIAMPTEVLVLDVTANPSGDTASRVVGRKRYELKNHLGNVLAVITDKKICQVLNNEVYYEAEVVYATDYYPFGSMMQGREYEVDTSYRYGFNGQEKDDEFKGESNSLNYTYRMHDPRLGRFFAIDPLSPKYPMLTPYQFSSNNPIWMREIEGLEGEPTSTVLTSPVGDAVVTSRYGAERTCAECSPTHAGTDYRAAVGTNVQATAPGTVVRSDYSSSYGNVVIIDHGQQAGGTDHVYTLYAHLSERSVEVGQEVNTSQSVGQSGNTGRSEGPHVHYEVIVSPTTNVEPQIILAFYNDDLTRAPEDLPALLPANARTVQAEANSQAGETTANGSAQSEGQAAVSSQGSGGNYPNMKNSAPSWAKETIVGEWFYFITTGKDPTLPDMYQQED